MRSGVLQGDQDYNRLGADVGRNNLRNGCPAVVTGARTSVDTISVLAEDMGNTGCLGNAIKWSQISVTSVVAPIADEPLVVLANQGQDVCENCRSCPSLLASFLHSPTHAADENMHNPHLTLPPKSVLHSRRQERAGCSHRPSPDCEAGEAGRTRVQ